ncbi:MAG: porin family protein [Bacteroidota bacterium]
MNKKLLAFLFVLAFAKMNVSYSQFSLGIRGGVNFSQLKTDFKSQSFGDNLQQSLDTKTGYVGGIYARIGSKIFIQPELIFSAKGGNINILKSGSTNAQTVAIDYTSIDVPLLVGFKLGPLRLNAGPMASFTVSSKGLDEALKQYASNIGDSFKNASYGYQAGGGLDIGSLSVDLRYEGSLSEVAGVNSLNNINFSQKGNLWQLTLGLRIL